MFVVWGGRCSFLKYLKLVFYVVILRIIGDNLLLEKDFENSRDIFFFFKTKFRMDEYSIIRFDLEKILLKLEFLFCIVLYLWIKFF